MSKVGVKFPYTAENDITYLATVLNTYEDGEGTEVATVSLSGTEDVMVVNSDIVPEGGGTTTILPLTVTSNGTYSEEGVAYNPVTVNVEGGSGSIIDDFAMRTLSGSISGNASFIASSAFASYNNLTEVNFPSCATISSNAFYGCKALTNASFPSCTTIENYAFRFCSSLSTISFPSCTTIGDDAFYGCSNLTSANFPSCTTIGDEAFCVCSSLSTISFPFCTTIGDEAFYGCKSLTSVNFPLCTSIGSTVFRECGSLSIASFPTCTTIGNYAFSRCYNLLSLYLLGDVVPTLNASNSVFSSTPIDGYTTSTGGVYGSIFVKASMLTNFQTATYWSEYSSRMVGLTDAQIEELNNG